MSMQIEERNPLFLVSTVPFQVTSLTASGRGNSTLHHHPLTPTPTLETHTHQERASWAPVLGVQTEQAADTRLGVREEPGEGAGTGHRSLSGGARIRLARPGSQCTLILLSARPGAGLTNVMFQRKFFPFSPQERKKQKDKQTPRVLYWETGQHMGLRQAPPLLLLQALCGCLEVTAIASLSLCWPRTNGFHSLSREEGAWHGRINLDPTLVPASLPRSPSPPATV